MATAEQLPHLLRLVDDPSVPVRHAVARELAAYGPRLDVELRKLVPAPTEDQLREVRALLEQHHREWLSLQWISWMRLPDDKDRVESALTLLARYQYGHAYPLQLPALLDQLAEDCRQRDPQPDPFTLAHYLFQVCPLRGNRKNYYDPRNSNLVFCILERKGNPISLSCIYLLVGRRLGLDIEGLLVPGHFLARARHGETTCIVDCFDGGRFLSAVDLASLDRRLSAALAQALKKPARAGALIARVLRNLHRAYLREGREADAMLMIDLLHHSCYPHDEECTDLY